VDEDPVHIVTAAYNTRTGHLGFEVWPVNLFRVVTFNQRIISRNSPNTCLAMLDGLREFIMKALE
jgi:hypothetical protein